MKNEIHFSADYNQRTTTMNSAINNALQQYLDTFMNTVVERFGMDIEELQTLWKETQKKKFPTKNKTNNKRKKSSVPSAYILFCQDERIKIKDNHPDMAFPDVAKELGRRWKNANEGTKAHYKKQHDILMVKHQQQQTTTTDIINNENENEDDVASLPPPKEDEPPKTKKSKAIEIPENITNDRERELWPEFAKLTVAELRTQCDFNNIKRSKNRNDMIHTLIIHRISLEDGNTQMDSDEED